jgi:hypothetical protein
MTKMNRTILILAALMLPVSANAVLMTFTDQAAFMAALPGSANTLDFDGLTGGNSTDFGTIIADGDTVDGITFNYDFGGVQMEVRNDFLTTSPDNYLGTTDGGVLLDGDEFSLSFAPVNAIGMSFITADTMLDGDITLSAGGDSVSLVAADAGADLGDGGIPFFLGLIDTTNTFTSADIFNIGGEFFFYNVDDIVTSVVPVPGAIWLFLSALAGLGVVRKQAR